MIQTTHYTAVVEKVIALLEEKYVFPDVAQAIGAHLRTRLAANAYTDVTDAEALCRALTEDIQSINQDRHLRVFTQEPSEEPETDAQQDARLWFEREERYENYGFHRLERLKGNVGYLDLRFFADVEGAGDTAAAAMQFLMGMDAVIFDLRKNGGGSPYMVQFLTTYLFSESKHLNSFYFRKGDQTEQFWTLPYVPGKRRPDIPAYVLTSKRTFSGAEEFTYNLKHLKRATIIGEATGGGAHPGQSHPLADGLWIFIADGRAINPITQSNWEGTGVEPDIAVPEAEALPLAHLAALRTLLERAEIPQLKANLTRDLAIMEAEYQISP